MADYPRTRVGLERAGFSRITKAAVCRGCDAPIEWWKTPTGRKIPLTVTIRGQFEQLTMHMESCPNRGQFKGAASGPGAPKPGKYTNEAAVGAMRDRTNARVVILIEENGAVAASWRKDIPAEDLRHDLISAANFVRNAVNEKGDPAR
jgi:hypothetical protein